MADRPIFGRPISPSSTDPTLRPVAERGFLPNLRPLFLGELVRRLSPVPSGNSLARPLLATPSTTVTVPAAAPPASAEETKEIQQEPGLWGPTFTTCSATLGAGALSLPYAMHHMGLVFGLAMLALAALATHFSISLLVSVMDVTRLYSYEELTVHAFGRGVGVARADSACPRDVNCLLKTPKAPNASASPRWRRPAAGGFFRF